MKKILFFIFFSIGLVAQESYIDYISPYHPTAVTSEQGMVVSQNYLSSDIGIEILDKGWAYVLPMYAFSSFNILSSLNL